MLKKAHIQTEYRVTRRKRQTWNGYFFVINENASSFLFAMKRLPNVNESFFVINENASSFLFAIKRLPNVNVNEIFFLLV